MGMIERAAKWAERRCKSKTIYGCEGDGTGDSPYLTRTVLFATPLGNVYLHRFHRSDRDDLHDHPFHYVSVILCGGYIEVVNHVNKRTGATTQTARRKRPGMILFRKATHRHRIALIDGREALTLIYRTPYVREWGFWIGGHFMHWKKYFEFFKC